ncbi:MAG: hypothetical protein M1816_000400 [Peltula sp. TS41687]|nr:MAG: hypothetical protein M1816_000400 [Peltula sp. TS41687]
MDGTTQVPVVTPLSISHSSHDGIEKGPFAGTEGAYLLPHNQVEVERLQRQHRFMTSATFGRLVPFDLPREAKVLDSGCADGTWLVDLNTQEGDRLDLHGVDLSDRLFLSHPDLDLRVHDIREPFPSLWGWMNTFDLVHQRLLIWGITATEWPAVVCNLLEAVRPGGYIQLVEAQWILPDVPNHLPEQKKLNLVQTWSTDCFGGDIHIHERLEELLRRAGCVDVTMDSFPFGYGAQATEVEDRISSAELWVESFRHLAGKITEDGIPGVAQTAVEYHAFLDRLVLELKEYGYTPKLKWICGRKSS